MARVLSALAFASICALTACSGAGGPHPPKPACGGRASEPFSPALVARILRGHGFTVHLLLRDDWCAPDRIVLSNQTDYVFNTNEAVNKRQGWYTCALFNHSQQAGFRRDLHAKPNAVIAGSSHADWDLANITCSLYPSSSNHWDAQIHAFDVAIATLARQR